MNQTRCEATLVLTATLMVNLRAVLKTRMLQTSSSVQNLRVSSFACVFHQFLCRRPSLLLFNHSLLLHECNNNIVINDVRLNAIFPKTFLVWKFRRIRNDYGDLNQNFDRGHPVVLILTIVYIQYNRLTQHPMYI